MRFEWDNNKNLSNIEKHGISFDAAKEILSNPFQLSILDYRFNYYEERWITMGKAKEEYLLLAAHLYYDENGDEVVRIISARHATAYERRQYEYER